MKNENIPKSNPENIHSVKLHAYIVLIIFFVAFSFISFVTMAQSDKRIKQFNIENKLAIKGYDPVSYFTKAKAEKGNKTFSYSFEGITYYFTNAGNKDLFTKAPQKFEPQYGGWCAYAMGAKGEKVEVDPETFKIVEGKLYLFYHAFLTNTLNSWNDDEKNLKIKADANWKKIFN